MNKHQIEQNWFALTGRRDLAVKLRRLMDLATAEELKIIFGVQKDLLLKDRELFLRTRELQDLKDDSKKLNRDRKHLQEQVHHLSNQLRSR